MQFYRQGLGFALLYRFEDHDGFDGIMLGHEQAPYHFEFTRARGHVAGRAPTRDNLLVFFRTQRTGSRPSGKCVRQASSPFPHSIPTGTARA